MMQSNSTTLTGTNATPLCHGTPLAALLTALLTALNGPRYSIGWPPLPPLTATAASTLEISSWRFTETSM